MITWPLTSPPKLSSNPYPNVPSRSTLLVLGPVHRTFLNSEAHAPQQETKLASHPSSSIPGIEIKCQRMPNNKSANSSNNRYPESYYAYCSTGILSAYEATSLDWSSTHSSAVTTDSVSLEAVYWHPSGVTLIRTCVGHWGLVAEFWAIEVCYWLRVLEPCLVWKFNFW